MQLAQPLLLDGCRHRAPSAVQQASQQNRCQFITHLQQVVSIYLISSLSLYRLAVIVLFHLCMAVLSARAAGAMLLPDFVILLLANDSTNVAIENDQSAISSGSIIFKIVPSARAQ